MKNNPIKKSLDNVKLSDEAKERIINTCYAADVEDKIWLPRKRGLRVALVAACVLMLSIAIYATAGIVSFYMEREGNEVRVSAGLESTVKDNIEEPNRAWNADEDEIMIKLDGTANKSRLGANAILAVSIAVAKAAADHLKLPLYRYLGGVDPYILPVPMINIVNGGAHSNAPVAFQEFMIRPVGANSFSEAMLMASNVFYSLKKILRQAGMSTSVGDEGGFAPNFNSAEEALNYIMYAIQNAGYIPAKDITLALDCAATEFYDKGYYNYAIFEQEGGAKRSTDEQIAYLKWLVEKYPIDSIEDPLAENDWIGWQKITAELSGKCQLVGDDLFVTNARYLERGIKERCANAVLVKVNQIGTLTETLKTIALAQRNGYKCIISHRSGETEDPFIADLAVAVNAGQIKTGSMSRSERMAKYNQLLRIEEQLGRKGRYFGSLFE